MWRELHKERRMYMNQMIRNLYLSMRKEENMKNVISKEFQEEIIEMLKSEMGEKEEPEFEKICDIAFLIGGTGEENGFVKGFKCAWQLLFECAFK